MSAQHCCSIALSELTEKAKEPRSVCDDPPTKKPTREVRKKGKGKGSNGAFVRIPHLLKLNCVAATPKNNRICFSYNLKKCDVNGQKCGKGFHVCAFSRTPSSSVSETGIVTNTSELSDPQLRRSFSFGRSTQFGCQS